MSGSLCCGNRRGRKEKGKVHGLLLSLCFFFFMPNDTESSKLKIVSVAFIEGNSDTTPKIFLLQGKGQNKHKVFIIYSPMKHMIYYYLEYSNTPSLIVNIISFI